jgi:hypothetical protein
MIVPYRRFGTTYWPHVQGLTALTLKVGPIGCPETSVQNYHSSLRKITEERRYHFYGGGSLNSRIISCN